MSGPTPKKKRTDTRNSRRRRALWANAGNAWWLTMKPAAIVPNPTRTTRMFAAVPIGPLDHRPVLRTNVGTVGHVE